MVNKEQNDKYLLMIMEGFAKKLEESKRNYRKDKAQLLRKLRYDYFHNPNDTKLFDAFYLMSNIPGSSKSPKPVYTRQNFSLTNPDFLRFYLGKHYYEWNVNWFVTFEECEISNDLLSILLLWRNKTDLLLHVLENK